MLKNRVAELRVRFNLTQEELAERIGASKQTIVSLENGSYSPYLLLAINISIEFDMPIEEIFFRES